MPEDLDKIEEMEAKDTAHKLPLGWLVVFIGLILFGIYYFAAYSPATSGWTQSGEYQKSIDKK